jgi:uncharacterized membrane protein
VRKNLSLKLVLPYLYIVLAIIGIIISFWLTYDKIQVLKDPSYKPICDINPILSCGDVMGTKQSDLLGVPNPIFGMFGFSMLLTFGLVLATGSKLRREIWLMINAGALAGFCFFVYLFFQAVFRIHAICPFCFVIWMITPPILWYTTVYNIQEANLKLKFMSKNLRNGILAHHGQILFCWYLIVFMTLLTKFWYYWKTLI